MHNYKPSSMQWHQTAPLKITLLIALHVITNVVTPKCDKQTKTKLEIKLHHHQSNAISAGQGRNPASNSYEILFR